MPQCPHQHQHSTYANNHAQHSDGGAAHTFRHRRAIAPRHEQRREGKHEAQHIGSARECVYTEQTAAEEHRQRLAFQQLFNRQKVEHNGKNIVAESDRKRHKRHHRQRIAQHDGRGRNMELEDSPHGEHTRHQAEQTKQAHTQQPHRGERPQHHATHNATQIVHKVVAHGVGSGEDVGIHGHILPIVAHIEAEHHAQRKVKRHGGGGPPQPKFGLTKN